MDLRLTPDQREIQALAREVAQAEIEPHAAQWDREPRFPRELYPRLAELGLMGVCVPDELGGAGADFVSYILVLEELSRADAGVGVTVAVALAMVVLGESVYDGVVHSMATVSTGGFSPRESISRTLVPLKKTRSSLSWAQVLCDAIAWHFLQ